MKTKIISLWQPWASLWVMRIKRSETRSWALPSSIDTLLVHAAKRQMPLDELAYFAELSERYSVIANVWNDIRLPPYGAIIGKVHGVHSRKMDSEYIEAQSELERSLGDWQEGRYAWEGTAYTVLDKPIPCKGRQGLWTPDETIIQAVRQQGIYLEYRASEGDGKA